MDQDTSFVCFNSEKYHYLNDIFIEPKPPVAPDPKEIKAEQDSIAAIKKYIAEFNSEWGPLVKRQIKERNALERKLKTKAKALKGTDIVNYFKEFMTDMDTDSDWYSTHSPLSDSLDIFEYLRDGNPLDYEDFENYYQSVTGSDY